ncbi:MULTISPECIES: ATP-binding protein [unclassified Streptomyces]|uniref:ATP-binding protein n=1 Tax=unclassified Streptomyces TaxID=2593676 RepID=UPI0033CCAEAA
MGTNRSTMLAPLRQGLYPTDPSTAATSASCALPPRHEAVRGARQFTRATLGQWDLAHRFDDVALVVSELVTNALRHALAPEGGPTRPECEVQVHEQGGETPVRLHLMRWTGRLVCAVRDPSDEGPTARQAEEDFAAESGRGLLLVESFSDGWGWHPLAGALRGKVVWALFRLG